MLFLLISLGVAWLIDYYELHRIGSLFVIRIMRGKDLGRHEEEDYLTYQGSSAWEQNEQANKAKNILICLLVFLMVGLVCLVSEGRNDEDSGNKLRPLFNPLLEIEDS